MIDLCDARDYTFQPVRCLQHKADGHHVLICKTDSRIYAKTKTPGIDIWPKLMLFGWIRERIDDMAPETAIAGELHAPGVPATSVKTLLNKLDERLRLTVFAIPIFAGLPQHSPAFFEGLEENCDFEHVNSQIIELGFNHPITDLFDTKRFSADEVVELEEAATLHGIEGFVAKNGHYRQWFKIKPVKTVDCKIIHATKSFAPTHFGDLEAVLVALREGEKWITVASVGTGFSAEFRESVNRKSLVGRVCEISYNGLAANGKLLWPRFVRFRDDKPEKDCTICQLESRI